MKTVLPFPKDIQQEIHLARRNAFVSRHEMKIKKRQSRILGIGACRKMFA
jgi:hypothetical protein